MYFHKTHFSEEKKTNLWRCLIGTVHRICVRGWDEAKILTRTFLVTVYPSSLGPFFIISYYIKCV